MTQGHHARRKPSARPRLVPLEDRAVPSVTNPADPPQPPALTVPALATPIVAIGAEVGNRPAVRVIDAATGQTRFAFEAYESSFRGGVRVATGDVNGDGIMDLVTAAGPGGGPLIKVYDGASGVMLNAFCAYDPIFRGGVYIAVADVNNDGFDDIVTGASEGGGPHVRVFNGAWAAPPVRALPMTPDTTIPTAADGEVPIEGELPVEPPADPPVEPPVEPPVDPPVEPPVEPPIVPPVEPPVEPPVVPPVEPPVVPPVEPPVQPPMPVEPPIVPPPVYTPPPIDTWTPVLFEFMAYSMDFRGGIRVAAGDVTGDGKADIITAAGPSGGPHVRIFDSTNAQICREFMAYASAFTGGVYVTAGDIDGDGFAEVATSTGAGGGSRVHIYHGINGALSRSFMADPSRPMFGIRVRLVDFNNDGQTDLLVGAGQRLQVRDPQTGTQTNEVTPLAGPFVNGLNLG